MYKYQEFIASRGWEYSQTPLIVNADGWVKCLGYEILSAIIEISNPDHIVQILGNTKAKSFDLTSFHSFNNSNSCSRRCVHTIQSFDDISTLYWIAMITNVARSTVSLFLQVHYWLLRQTTDHIGYVLTSLEDGQH
jgi:hypothetical protein